MFHRVRRLRLSPLTSRLHPRRLPPSVLPHHLMPAGMVTPEPLSIRVLSFAAVGAPRLDAQVFCFGDKVGAIRIPFFGAAEITAQINVS